MKKYLISYGDNNYKDQREFFRQTAISSGFFDHIQVFTPEDIDPEFAAQVQEVLKFRKGGGYWIWKPYFLKKVLDTINEGDILIYCDAGCMINNKGEKRFKEYIDRLNNTKTGTIDFELPHKEIEYTKREVFNALDVSAEVIHSNQLVATVILLKKCAHTIFLIDTFYNTAIHNASLFTDEKDAASQHKEFIDHRHDQSIFSILRKTYGANIIPDETYFTDFIYQGYFFPFWATRLKG